MSNLLFCPSPTLLLSSPPLLLFSPPPLLSSFSRISFIRLQDKGSSFTLESSANQLVDSMTTRGEKAEKAVAAADVTAEDSMMESFLTPQKADALAISSLAAKAEKEEDAAAGKIDRTSAGLDRIKGLDKEMTDLVARLTK